ncbi:MAG: pilus assembly protein TadG-related protein [Sulfitobacter sp.]
MPPITALRRFVKDETGSILVIWAFSLVALLGFLGLIFDMGRLGSTQAELQSFADSVSLAAAAELDGAGDALTRAQAAADTLINDSQTFAEGDRTLSAADIALTFYRPGPEGRFLRDAGLVTTNPRQARFVQAQVAEHSIGTGFGKLFTSYGEADAINTGAAARAVAGFSLEACNVAPVAVCLPSIDFDAATSIGDTLALNTSASIDLNPGRIALVDTLTDQLDGLSICAGLLGGALDACLVAAREPQTACTGQGGLTISADADGTDALHAINTRFGQFASTASGLAGDPDFSGGPNVLTGLTDALGLCLPLGGLLGAEQVGLPADDCLISGGCSVQGSGEWSAGRAAYVAAHYDSNDPFPEVQTRFEFYQAEISAAASGSLPLLGGLLGGGFVPQLCAPQENQDPKRRLMVVAGIDCLSAEVDATVSVPPVQQFFEVFALGPAEGGELHVEITACLGGACGGGNLETEVRDIVRLVE